MREIIVGIGQYVHRSVDGGSTWARSLREIPGKRTLIVRGTVDLAGLPSRPPRALTWSPDESLESVDTTCMAAEITARAASTCVAR